MTEYETYPSPAPAPPPVAPRTLLVRSRHDKVLGGVCGGLATYTGYDATLIRIILVAATVFGLGSTIILYAAAWLLMPLEQ